MCSTPKMPDPKPIAPRQAPRLPDTAEIKSMNDDAARRRATVASMTFTTPSALQPATTAGKPTLGA